ncbi:MAG TPA: hypothetical protein VG370_22335 [Chloroflexota bacterium]|jgi:hypothetical protein|nr:hypothetical protein [Chloroflexota bacterium]
MMEPGGNRALAGAVLIVLGLGLFALQIVGGLGDAVVLFLIGGVFVFFYFARRVYGLLIPGCVLLGLGLGRVGEVAGFARGEVEGIGLGAGFLAIYLIDTIYRRRSHWWPLIPGLILTLGGIVRLSADAQRLLSVGWPILLILAGLVLLAGGLGIGRRV